MIREQKQPVFFILFFLFRFLDKLSYIFLFGISAKTLDIMSSDSLIIDVFRILLILHFVCQYSLFIRSQFNPLRIIQIPQIFNIGIHLIRRIHHQLKAFLFHFVHNFA